MTPKPIVFVDTETTGLLPDVHEIWEVGLIYMDTEHDSVDRHWLARHGISPEHPNVTTWDDKGERFGIRRWVWKEKVWLLPVDLGRADPISLEISGYYGRRRGMTASKADFAREFERLTRHKHMCGNVVSFDMERLSILLRANGACPGWHYHPVDVENLAAGWVMGKYSDNEPAEAQAISLPWKSDELSLACGVEPPTGNDRHSAIGDARWAKRWYEALFGELPESVDLDPR